MLAYLHHLDSATLYTIQSIGPFWYFTADFLSNVVGSTLWLAPVMAAALFFIGKRRVALEVVFIFVICTGVLLGLKHVIDAPRPYIVDSHVIQYATDPDPGMPSGHAFISFVILGWVWIRHPKKAWFTSGIAAVIALVGLSRIYLGLHYPSQVLAGWALGALMLWLFLWIDRWYFRPRENRVS